MKSPKMMTHQEVLNYLESLVTPAEWRAAAKGEFWAIADVFVRAFGVQVKSKREALGMTQMELADYSGIQQKEISKIERGAGNPTLKTCKQLLSALNLDLQLVESE